MFLGWTLSNRVFCLNEDVEPPFTRVVRIACFVTNFTLVFGLFTSNKECTTPNSRFFSTSASFANPIMSGMTSFTMGSSITFRITSPFVRMLRNATRVFSIDWSMTFVAFLTFWSSTTWSSLSSSTCFAIIWALFREFNVLVGVVQTLPSLSHLLFSPLIAFPCLLCYPWLSAINTSIVV